MREGQVVSFADGKKYYIHDVLSVQNQKYYQLIEVNETAENFMNNSIVVKEVIEMGKTHFERITKEEFDNLENYI